MSTASFEVRTLAHWEASMASSPIGLAVYWTQEIGSPAKMKPIFLGG